MREAKLVIARTWDGDPIDSGERATLQLRLDSRELRVGVDAPFHGDPPPPGPPGPRDRLWEYEVVELFLLGAGERYLEVELGPHGHHWVLELEGARGMRQQGLSIAYQTRRSGGRWAGEARIPSSHLPTGLRASNAYAIHGRGESRRHLAMTPVGGSEPDFHRLEAFVAIPWRKVEG